MQKTFEELTESERRAFATDTLMNFGSPDAIRHARLNITITRETMNRVFKWHQENRR